MKRYSFITAFTAILGFSGPAYPVITVGHRITKAESRNTANRAGPKKYAIVVGIEKFRRNSGWKNLQFAHNDASRMSKMLRDYGFTELKTIRSREATKRNIIKAIRWAASKAGRDDSIFVYISSHGELVEVSNKKTHSKRFIITADSNSNTSATALSVLQIRKILEKSKSQKKLLMLAACYTGRMKIDPGLKGRKQLRAKKIKGNTAFQILSASSEGQAAYEHTEVQGDVYTYFFLQCLKSKKKSGRSTLNAHICSIAKTRDFVRKHKQREQIPTAAFRGNRDINFSLGKKDPSGIVGITNKLLLRKGVFASITSRISIQNIKLGKGKPKQIYQSYLSAEQYIGLPPGRYLVRISNKRKQLYQQHIEIKDGQITWPREPIKIELKGDLTGTHRLGNIPSWGGDLGIRHRFFGVFLSGLGSELAYPKSSTRYQLALSTRLELGYTWHWVKVELFLGGYLGGGLLLQSVPSGKKYGPFMIYGTTLNSIFWLSRYIGISIQGAVGFSIVQLASTLQHPFEWSVKAGLSLRL